MSTPSISLVSVLIHKALSGSVSQALYDKAKHVENSDILRGSIPNRRAYRSVVAIPRKAFSRTEQNSDRAVALTMTGTSTS